jgi:hypothetical protein
MNMKRQFPQSRLARINEGDPITPEDISSALQDYGRFNDPIPSVLLVEMLSDQRWLLAGRLPLRYKGRGKQGLSDPDKAMLWTDARAYMELCSRGIINDSSPTETVAEQFEKTERHIATKIATNHRYEPARQVKSLIDRHGDEGAGRVARTLMVKAGELYRAARKKP